MRDEINLARRLANSWSLERSTIHDEGSRILDQGSRMRDQGSGIQ